MKTPINLVQRELVGKPRQEFVVLIAFQRLSLCTGEVRL